MAFRQNWGEERVYFHSESGRLVSIPASWTDVLPPDPFVVVSAGRALFRMEDLMTLIRLIEGWDNNNEETKWPRMM